MALSRGESVVGQAADVPITNLYHAWVRVLAFNLLSLGLAMALCVLGPVQRHALYIDHSIDAVDCDLYQPSINSLRLSRHYCPLSSSLDACYLWSISRHSHVVPLQ